ncbi:MAG: ParB/RepB/Spo0J family partition protein [bacterium]
MTTAAALKQKRLGRGLESLVPVSDRAKILTEIDITRIKTNPHQPRQHFDKKDLADLSESIKQHGVIQPLLVMQSGSNYTLIAGERRLQASKLAGLDKVPVVIRDVTSKEMLELAIIENVQRADLNPLEEAVAYQQLIDEFGLTQTDVAVRLGKNHSTISNTLRLLQLPQEVKKALVEDDISEGHARALLGASSSKMLMDLFQHVVQEKLSVRETERLVRDNNAIQLIKSTKNKSEKPLMPQKVQQFEQKLAKKFNLPVSVNLSRRGGKVVIRFKDFSDIEGIFG